MGRDGKAAAKPGAASKDFVCQRSASRVILRKRQPNCRAGKGSATPGKSKAGSGWQRLHRYSVSHHQKGHAEERGTREITKSRIRSRGGASSAFVNLLGLAAVIDPSRSGTISYGNGTAGRGLQRYLLPGRRTAARHRVLNASSEALVSTSLSPAGLSGLWVLFAALREGLGFGAMRQGFV